MGIDKMMKVYDYRNIHKFSRTRLDYYKMLHIFIHDRIYGSSYINYAYMYSFFSFLFFIDIKTYFYTFTYYTSHEFHIPYQ